MELKMRNLSLRIKCSLSKINSTFFCAATLKSTVMKIEKPLINDCLRVSKVSWKFHIAAVYNFAVIYPWNLLFSWKVAYFLSFLFINKTLRFNDFKARKAMNPKTSVVIICVKAIIYSLLYNLHDSIK